MFTSVQFSPDEAGNVRRFSMSGSPWLRAGHEGRSDLVTSGGMINQRHRAAPIIGGGEATLLAVISTSAQKSSQNSTLKRHFLEIRTYMNKPWRWSRYNAWLPSSTRGAVSSCVSSDCLRWWLHSHTCFRSFFRLSSLVKALSELFQDEANQSDSPQWHEEQCMCFFRLSFLLRE